MALIPTLTLFEVEAKKFGESEQDLKGDLDAGVQQVSAYSKAGGEILFGTDVGYTDAYDTTEEYRQLGRALDWRPIERHHSVRSRPSHRTRGTHHLRREGTRTEK
jgi:hypothetical protein